MPQQPLHFADVVTVGQKMCREEKAEWVAGPPLSQSSISDSLSNSLLQNGFVDVMPPMLVCLLVRPAIFLREAESCGFEPRRPLQIFLTTKTQRAQRTDKILCALCVFVVFPLR
jgi:hypothetical protein